MHCMHQYSANKRVLSNCLKLFAVNSGLRSSSHRQFQAAGPATEKARRPYVERLCRRTSSWRRLAERRWRRDATSEIGVQQSVRYEGALPWRQLYIIVASLYFTRSGTSSQWRSTCISWDSPRSNIFKHVRNKWKMPHSITIRLLVMELNTGKQEAKWRQINPPIANGVVYCGG